MLGYSLYMWISISSWSIDKLKQFREVIDKLIIEKDEKVEIKKK
jgi:hypothetical protein